MKPWGGDVQLNGVWDKKEWRVRRRIKAQRVEIVEWRNEEQWVIFGAPNRNAVLPLTPFTTFKEAM